jgi:hypothetical protein
VKWLIEKPWCGAFYVREDGRTDGIEAHNRKGQTTYASFRAAVGLSLGDISMDLQTKC